MSAAVCLGGVVAEKKRKIRLTVHIIVSVLLLVATLLFAVFRFAPVFERFIRSIVDFGLSIAYFIATPFGAVIQPAVQEFPAAQMQELLPLTVDEFVLGWGRFWSLFETKQNLAAYSEKLLEVLIVIAMVSVPFVLVSLIFALVVWLGYRRIDTEKKGNTWQLNAFLWVKRRTYFPAKKAVKRYCAFVVENKWWFIIPFGVLWAYNLNLLTVALELLAFVFYVAISQNYANVVVQVVKLIVDLSVPTLFFPIWAWILFGYYLFHLARCSIAKTVRDYYVKKDDEFLDKHPGALYFGGKQRSKKTSILTACKQLFERRFRKKAHEKIRARKKQFPFFNWQNYLQVVQRCRERRVFVKFKDVNRFVYRVKAIYERCEEINVESYRRSMLRYYGYDINDFFEYAENYSMWYNNGITHVSIYSALLNYAKLFLIYNQRSTLDVSNYPIREDFDFDDYGAWPKFDGDLFRDPKESAELSQYGHKINWDWFRLGDVFDPTTAYETAIEYGIGCAPEVAKERKNKATKSAAIKANPDGPNQNNDFFELDTKIRGQLATIDNFDFWVWLFDDQRFDSLGAESKDLTTQCLIKQTTPEKLFLPLFGIEKCVIGWITKAYDAIVEYIENRKSKNTLLVYILNCLLSPVFRFMDRQSKRYSVYVATLKTTDGADGEVLGEAEKFYLLTAMTYKNVFATDYCRSFYDLKYDRATRSIDDVEKYSGLHPTVRELKSQNSYFSDDMTYAFGSRGKPQPNAPESVKKRGSTKKTTGQGTG